MVGMQKEIFPSDSKVMSLSSDRMVGGRKHEHLPKISAIFAIPTTDKRIFNYGK